jgi:hypothetical protein
MKRFLVVLVLMLIGFSVAQSLRVLYNPDIPVGPVIVQSTTRDQLFQSVQRATTGVLNRLGASYCPNQPSFRPMLKGKARGAFTRPRTDQTAYFFTILCEDGRNILGFIGVFEGRRLVASALTKTELGAVFKEMYSIRDINRDGLDEMAYVTEIGETASGARLLHVVKFAQNRLVRFATTDVQHIEVDLDSGVISFTKDVNVLVESGARPRFFEQSRDSRRRVVPASTTASDSTTFISEPTGVYR